MIKHTMKNKRSADPFTIGAFGVLFVMSMTCAIVCGESFGPRGSVIRLLGYWFLLAAPVYRMLR